MQVNLQAIVNLFLDPASFAQHNIQEQSAFITILRNQKLLARFAYFLQSELDLESLDERVRRHLRNSLTVSKQQNKQVLSEVNEIKSILENESKFVVFLKGAAYSISGNLVGKGRIYSDIDVLVNKEDIKMCEQALALHGWLGEEISSYDDKYYRKWAHEIPPLRNMKRGTIIDVHHNIIPIVSKDAPTVAALASHIEIDEDGIQVLNEAAQFVHSAVHLFRNEEYKNAFRDLLDLYLIVKDKPNSFYSQIIQVAQTLGFSYETGLALYFIKYHLQLPINSNIISSLLLRSKIRTAFDIYLFKNVLLPSHRLIKGNNNIVKYGLAAIRGHCIKMPFYLLMYHLTVKSGRIILEKIFGQHIFTPKDELAEKKNF